jgi:hypothetical protein
MVGYWIQQVNSGMLGSHQLDINLNTMANISESINIFVRVHKPGRFESYLK